MRLRATLPSLPTSTKGGGGGGEAGSGCERGCGEVREDAERSDVSWVLQTLRRGEPPRRLGGRGLGGGGGGAKGPKLRSAAGRWGRGGYSAGCLSARLSLGPERRGGKSGGV